MIEGYKYSKEQLHLLIHNCRVYGINPNKWVKMLNELEKNDKDE